MSTKLNQAIDRLQPRAKLPYAGMLESLTSGIGDAVQILRDHPETLRVTLVAEALEQARSFLFWAESAREVEPLKVYEAACLHERLLWLMSRNIRETGERGEHIHGVVIEGLRAAKTAREILFCDGFREVPK